MAFRCLTLWWRMISIKPMRSFLSDPLSSYTACSAALYVFPLHGCRSTGRRHCKVSSGLFSYSCVIWRAQASATSRASSALRPYLVVPLLQSDADASVVGQGCPARSRNPATWGDCCFANPVGAAPLLCPDIIFGNHRSPTLCRWRLANMYPSVRSPTQGCTPPDSQQI